ncbi:MAG: hypothetical protein HC913_19460 [Microscillaceae bacterium]|nr:hypothetical protein [Microscillaceae bacterium]
MIKIIRKFPQYLAIILLFLASLFLNCQGQVPVNALNQHIITSDKPPASPLHFTNLTYRQGLPKGNVNQLLQDRNGYLWLGIVNVGLVRYDGTNFKHFSNQKNSIPVGDIIYHLEEDKKGRIWLISNAGLFCFFPETEKFISIKKHFNNKIIGFVTLPSGELLIICDAQKWFVFNPENFKKTPLKIPKIVNLGTKEIYTGFPFIYGISLDKKGVLWITQTYENKPTPAGVYAFLPEKQEWYYYPFHWKIPGGKKFFQFSAPFMDKDGKTLWLIGWMVGVIRIDLHTWKVQHYYWKLPHRDIGHENTALALAQQGNFLYFGFASTLRIFDKLKNQFQAYVPEVGNEYSLLPNKYINKIVQERNGLWLVAKNDGISIINPLLQQMPRRALLPRQEQVLSIFPDNSTQSIFFATLDSNFCPRIYQYFEKTRTYKVGEYQSYFKAAKEEINIFALEKDAGGRYWVATSKGMHWLNVDDLSLHPLNDLSQADKKRLNNNTVCRALHIGASHRLWIASLGQGLYCYHPPTKRLVHYLPKAKEIHSLRSTEVRAVFEDREGQVWIGYYDGNGLSRLNPKTGKFIHYLPNIDQASGLKGGNILGFNQDEQGRVWVATNGGLGYYRPASDDFFWVPELPYECSHPFFDALGQVWTRTIVGIYRYNSKTKKLKCFDEAYGLKGDFYYSKFWQGASKELFFRDDVRFFGENIQNDTVPPLPRLVSLKIHEKEFTSDTNINYLKK